MVDTADDTHRSVLSRLRRGAAVVFAGSALGYGITYLLTPILGRLVSPDAFGAFAAVLAVASLLTGFSTLRLEIFAASSESEEDQHNALQLAIATALIISISVSVLAFTIFFIANIPPIWLLVGPMVLMGSLQLIAIARGSIERRYPAMGIGNLIQGGGTGLGQLGFALASPTAAALAFGFLIARVHWVIAIVRLGTSTVSVRSTWERSRSFARTAGLGALLNSAGGQAPVLLISLTFGAAGAGLFAIAVRLLIGPLAIIAQAVGSTSIGEVGRLASNRDPRLPATLASLSRQLLIMGAAPCLAAFIMGPWLISILLGPAWADTGDIIRALSVGALAQFVGAPVTQTLNLMHRSRTLMYWEIARLLTFVAIFLILPSLDYDIIATCWAYSVALCIMYAFVWVLILNAARSHSTGRNANSSPMK